MFFLYWGRFRFPGIVSLVLIQSVVVVAKLVHSQFGRLMLLSRLCQGHHQKEDLYKPSFHFSRLNSPAFGDMTVTGIFVAWKFPVKPF